MVAETTISMETAFWFLGGVVSVVGALLVYIFMQLKEDVKGLKADMVDMRKNNDADHASVIEKLSAIEGAVLSQDKTMIEHGRRLDQHDEDLRELRKQG